MKAYIGAIIVILLCAFVIIKAESRTKTICTPDGKCIIYSCQPNGNGTETCIRIN